MSLIHDVMHVTPFHSNAHAHGHSYTLEGLGTIRDTSRSSNSCHSRPAQWPRFLDCWPQKALPCSRNEGGAKEVVAQGTKTN